MAILLSRLGLGPLVSAVSTAGSNAVIPGLPGADPAVDAEVRAQLVATALERVRERGGVPLERAQVSVGPGMMMLDGEYAPCSIWHASIVYGV